MRHAHIEIQAVQGPSKVKKYTIGKSSEIVIQTLEQNPKGAAICPCQHIPLLSSRMNLQWITLALTVLPIYSSSILPLSKITLVNNQYQRVSVELSPDISEEYGIQVIHSLKEIFKKTSTILELATRKITSFGKIRIIVPSSWNNKSGLIETTTLKTNSHLSPFRIDNPHPVYGDEPYTLQPQQCGEQGLYIHLTPSFITKTSAYNGKNIAVAARKLVHNWIRYRYGVFPETGDQFHNQRQFPTVYATEDGMKPTGCNNQPLDFDWVGKCYDGSRNCNFSVNARQDKTLTTSLMSWPNLEGMNSFCDRSNHNSLAPTIHNALCQSRSVWDVLHDHEDLRINRIPTGASALSVPEFQIVRKENPKRVVIIIDTSSDQKNKVKLTTILAALNRFIMIYLPDNTQAAVIHYSDRLYLTKNLTNLDPVSRKHIRRTFLDYLESKSKAILTRALERAFEYYFMETGGICIVVSTGRFDPELKSEERINHLQQFLQTHPITLTSIVLGEAREDKQKPSPTTTEVLQSLSKLSGGEFLSVYEKQSSLDMLTQVDRILIQTAKLANPQLLHVAYEVMPAGIQAEGFYIDEDSSTEMMFSISLETQLWPIILTSPTGQQFHSEHFSYNDDENLKQVSLTIPSAEIGKWTYRIQPGNPNLNSAITVTSISNKTKPIELEGWISVKKSNVSTWPIVIYGKLMRGINPVINALLQATVIGTTEHTITLKDTGNGDPDVFNHDGVYSRYIPGHLKMGFYTVWLTASDNGTSKTRERTDLKDEIKKQPTGPFQRVASLGSFYVGHSGDICPPSRIADLHFLLASRNMVSLGWTEPGNDFDSGKVARYRFWWSDKVDCLTNIDSACRSELFPRVQVWAKGAGNYQAADVVLPSMPSTVMFIAITAEDSAYNPSPPSNTVAIPWNQVHPGQDNVQSSTILDKLPEGFKVTRKRCNIQCLQGSTLVVIIVGAVIIALILVAIVITLCFTEQRHNRRNQNPILRPRLDIRPEVGSESESASPEIVASSASNEESENQLAIILDQEPTDVGHEEPKRECKDPVKKLPTDDVLTYYPLIDDRKKSFTILHRPNCLINAHITQCACNCHSTIINSFADLYV